MVDLLSHNGHIYPIHSCFLLFLLKRYAVELVLLY